MKKTIGLAVFLLSMNAHAFEANSEAQTILANIAQADLNRESLIKVETQLIDMALQDAEKYKSEERLDSNLREIAAATSSFDTKKDESLHRLIAAVDGEHWTQFHTHHFSFWRSLFRCQGLTNDGKGNWWYSGTVSILRLRSKYEFLPEATAILPIPEALSHLGDNHIGDIDVDGDNLYVPIEDGPKYLHPYIGVYDAKTLTVKKYVNLPQAQQVDGVPWVAVEPSTKRVFSAQYYNTTQINVYDMDSLQPSGHIPMSRMVNAIQGAKVNGGMMYMTADGDTSGSHAVYKLNLATGTVIEIAQAPDVVGEIEGLTFTTDNSKLVMSVLGWYHGGLFNMKHIQLGDYEKDHPSLRDQFRKNISL